MAGDVGMLLHTIHYLALPSITLGLLLSGIFERIVRVNLKQTLQADYVEAARARGIPEKTILISHAMKNALIPVITVLGLTFAACAISRSLGTLGDISHVSFHLIDG